MSRASTSSGERVAAAALAAVGAQFRLHGRTPASGLDCVGLAAWALRAGGYAGGAPTGYGLRGGDPERIAAMLDAGLARADDERAGDLLLMRTGPGQVHLGVWTAAGLVHADASLNRVVVRKGAVEWSVLGRLRVGGRPSALSDAAPRLSPEGERE